MRKIRLTRTFKADFKQLKRSGRYADFEFRLAEIFLHFREGTMLPARFLDHPLTGDWIGYRDCHVYPDLLLLYREESGDSIALARLGSHGDIFG